MRNNAFNFKLDSVEQLLANNEQVNQKLINFINEINKPILKRRQVDISSKTIADWNKAGLIDVDTAEDKWHNFSFLEGIWLKFVNELRFFGVSLSVIRELKETLMDKCITELIAHEDFVHQFEDKSPEYYNAVKSFSTEASNNPEEVEQVFKDAKLNTFVLLVAACMIFDIEIGYYFDHEVAYFISLNKYETKMEEKHAKDVFSRMSRKTFAIISFKELIADFFDNDELDSLKKISEDLLNTNEQRLINAIRTGNYTQIQVKLDDSSITHLKLTKKNNDLMTNKIARLLKKGEYSEVSFTTKDGTIVKFEEIQTVKLNP